MGVHQAWQDEITIAAELFLSRQLTIPMTAYSNDAPVGNSNVAVQVNLALRVHGNHRASENCVACFQGYPLYQVSKAVVHVAANIALR